MQKEPQNTVMSCNVIHVSKCRFFLLKLSKTI